MSDSKQKFLFIDFLRFVAVCLMIQGHVFDALLSPQVKSHSLYYVHDFFHGFVAPAFLFSSGVAYGVSTLRRWDQHIVWGPRVRQRLERYLGLLAIGYALHLPYFSLRKTVFSASAAEIQALFQADVLQCVAVTLLLLQLGGFFIRKRTHYLRAVALVAAAVVFASPFMWSAHVAGRLPMWFASYLNSENGSWFPLFPWSAYLLCGVIFGSALANVQSHSQAVSLIRKNSAINAGLIVVALIVMFLPFDFYPAHDFWKSNPAMFVVRMSLVSLLASCIFFAERYLKMLGRVPLILGRESLFIYIVHLVIVYGSVLNRGLAQWIGPTLGMFPSLAVVGLVFAVILLITIYWHDLKSKNESAAQWVRTVGATSFLILFLLRRW